MKHLHVTITDGGRAVAGFKPVPKRGGDCAARALSLATGVSYTDVWFALATAYPSSYDIDRHGVHKRVWLPYLLTRGFTWIPTMARGTGCRVHVRADELPWLGVPYVVRVTKHLTVFHDGTLLDKGDCSRGGTRCVYGIIVPNAKAEIAQKFFQETA